MVLALGDVAVEVERVEKRKAVELVSSEDVVVDEACVGLLLVPEDMGSSNRLVVEGESPVTHWSVSPVTIVYAMARYELKRSGISKGG